MVMSANNNSITAVEMNPVEENRATHQFELEKPEGEIARTTKGKYSAVPSELSRMWVLMGRGKIQFYRDWVRISFFFSIACDLHFFSSFI